MTTTDLPRPLRALAHRDFRQFFVGGLVSSVGTNMQIAALAWVVQRETGSALRTTLIAFVGVVPLLVLGPAGGVLADRFARRRLLVVTNGVMMLLAVALWLAWERYHAGYSALFVLSLLTGVVVALQTPAWQSLPAELVPPTDLSNAITLNSTQFNVARALGPMAAGITIERFGAGTAFGVNALSYIVVIGALARMSAAPVVAPMTGEGTFERWRAGLRYVRSRRGLVVAIGVHSVFALAGAPIVQLVPDLAQSALHIDAAAYGLLLGALGIGAVGAAIVHGATDERGRASTALRIGLALATLGLAGLALAPSLPWAIAAMIVFGAAYLVIVAADHGTIQRLSDDAHRGRVTSVWLMTFGFCFPTGVVTMGWLADRVGVRWVLAGDAAIMAAVLVVASVRRLLPAMDA